MQTTEEQKEKLSRSLFKAAGKGSIKKVKSLIAQDADINYQDEHGISILMNAVIHSNVMVVRLLLDLKADVDLVDITGATAFTKALEGSDTCINMLLHHVTDTQKDEEIIIKCIKTNDLDKLKNF